MAAATQTNPISDLMYDWLTVLQSKAEGLNAYEKYIRDAQQENATECVDLLRRLHEQDAKDQAGNNFPISHAFCGTAR